MLKKIFKNQYEMLHATNNFLFYIIIIALVLIIIILIHRLKPFFYTLKYGLPNYKKFGINILKQSLSKSVIITISISGLGTTSVNVTPYNDFILYIKSLVSNILVPSVKASFDIPSMNFYQPKFFGKESFSFTNDEFNLYHDVKWTIASHNINSSVLDNLWHLFHGNLPMFLGIVGIILYSFLPNIAGRINTIISNNLDYINNIINRLYRSSIDGLSHIISYINIETSNQLTRAFFARLRNFTPNMLRYSRVVTSNRESLYELFLELERQTNNFTPIIQYLNHIGIEYVQDDDGTSTITINTDILPYISFEQMLELNPVLYNQIWNLNGRAETLLISISGIINDIARLLAQNSAIFENVFPALDPLDNTDLMPEILNYINNLNMYDLETFTEVFNEYKTEYNDEHFNN